MIERALRTINVNIKYFGDYTNNKPHKLLKLHGSVNWAHPVMLPFNYRTGSETLSISELIDSSNIFKVVPQYEFIDSPPPLAKQAMVPAIAIPIESKNEFECPPEFIYTLQTIIPQVDKIITIGWRETEKHFLNLLVDNLPQKVNMLVVAESPSSVSATIENIQIAGVKGNFKTSQDGFTEFIINRKIDDFLKSEVVK